MRHASRVCSLGLFVLALVTSSSPAEAAYDACTTPCKCSKRLAKASTFYVQKFETSVHNLVKMQRYFTRLLIAATAGNVATAQTALPTLAAAGKVIQECQETVTDQIDALKTGLPTLANASSNLAALARRGSTTTTLKITAQNTAGYFRDTSFADPPIAIKSDDSCGHEKEDDETNFDDNTTTERIPHNNCNMRQRRSNNCHSAPPTAGTGFLQFDLTSKTEQDTSKTPSRWGSAGADKDVIIQGEVNITQGTKMAQEALKDLKAAAANTSCDRQLTEYATVSTSPLFKRQAIRSLLNKPNNEQDSTNPPDKLTAPITAAYGEGGKEYKTKLWEAIETLKPPITKNKERAELDIKENTPLEQLTEAPAWQMDEANSKASQTTKNNKNANDSSKSNAADKTEDKKDGVNKATTECVATEEKYCDKTKCDWDAEKKQCKVKEGAVVIPAVIKVPFLFLQLFIEDFRSNL
ncbi:variant surface glycoprotein (VSG) [Trypanosoma brucei gambiense DAL972]|uniref:Variant surface glycoprotein (VSG) n=1 Tax=Trypanosoma brucei gambiense (strain MHOM/CI/86/DAL972) TaxID=679716 RepID=C9ZUG3_TRYB9|nr:variant surface glycoprotein (VSG) [Trypanosoma brucei gambiense DAL972]CBH13050.1 variant surface glycoprotein (VSG) [Trypanosoma brucei gambiense DAL972]|eukprot:XP_011775328.1 variant surface glycoprotein (VSG) [Trypanosoma brucei gambiense DAL972]